MKKKLILFCLLIASMLGVSACSSSPYENMNISSSVTDEIVQLEIKESYDAYNQKYYDYGSYSFDVTVADSNKNTDLGVTVVEPTGFINATVDYLGDGLSRITVVPTSHHNTGRVSLKVLTNEGNQSLDLMFNIDLKLDSFNFDDNVIAVQHGGTLDLNEVLDHVEFYPMETTQKDLKFEVVVPDVDGQIADWNNTYQYTPIDLENKYAEIDYENNKLVTYLGEGIVYPTMNYSATIDGNLVQTKCVTLKATYTSPKDGKVLQDFVDVIVIDNCSNYSLQMNNPNEGDDPIIINANANGEYDIVLLDPNSVSVASVSDFYFKRDLYFHLGIFGVDDYNPEEFFVDYNFTIPNDCPVIISNAGNNTFEIRSNKSGEFSHTFVIKNKHYQELVNQEIKVNFKVIDVPTNMLINNTAVKETYSVFDYYQNTYGERFNVSFNSKTQYQYFVYFAGEVNTNLSIYKNDGSEQVFALVTDGENGLVNISSSRGDEGIDYSLFNNKDSFYLRHTYGEIPDDPLQIYIAIKLTMAADSYSDEIKDTYFNDIIVSFPIKIRFEKGITEADLTTILSKYYFNLSGDVSDILLFNLPKGNTAESAIDIIEYDKELVEIYSFYDMTTKITSMYMKANTEFNIGETAVKLIFKNKIEKSFTVKTFIESSYQETVVGEDGTIQGNEMPLWIEIDKNSSGYLMSSTHDYLDAESVEDFDTPWELTYASDEIAESSKLKYTSYNMLVLAQGGVLKINFYDSFCYNFGSEYDIVKVDITDNVVVTFKNNRAVSYLDGYLYANALSDIASGEQMIITYKGGKLTTNEESGLLEYSEITVIQVVNICVYEKLGGVKLNSSKSANLYIKESLGCYDLGYTDNPLDEKVDLHTHTIVSTFDPMKEKLGSEWNNLNIKDENDDTWKPIALNYDYEKMYESYIYVFNENGKYVPLYLYSDDGTRSNEPIKYKDIFHVELSETDFTAVVTCEASEELSQWCNNNGYMQNFLSYIMSFDITFVVNIWVEQFGVFRNVTAVTFTPEFANKAENLNLEVEADGVYFSEIDDGFGEEDYYYKVYYNVEGENLVNDDIKILTDTSSLYFSALCEETDGRRYIKISPNKLGYAGVDYISIVTKDACILDNKGNLTYSINNPNVFRQFRIKIADGSKENPFEIRSIADYYMMADFVNSGTNYYYTLARDLNFANIAIPEITVDENGGIFSLNGEHVYYKDGLLVNRYSKIYNVSITKNIRNSTDNEVEYNVGLISLINSATKISNLEISNANITVNIQSKNVLLNVGILSGNMQSAGSIISTSVKGVITINTINADIDSVKINAGGMIGLINDGSTSELPATYTQGISGTGDNAYVSITINNGNNAKVDSLNVGGLFGLVQNASKIENMQIVSDISLKNELGLILESNIGGAIGKTNASVSKFIVSPKINILSKNVNDNFNVGGMLGTISGSSLDESKAYFKNIGDYYSVEQKMNIIVSSSGTANVGGLVGKTQDSTISYSYVRSFYDDYNSDETFELIQNTYLGNILLNSTKGSLGGISGIVNSSSIENSYYMGDLITNYANKDGKNLPAVNTGVLVGQSSNTEYNDTYGVGYVILNDNATYSLLSDKVDLVGMIGSSESDTINSSYAIVNKSIYYFVNSHNQSVTTGIDTSDIETIYGTYLGNIADGYETEWDTNKVNYSWFLNENINTLTIAGEISAYPTLLNKTKTKVMYDLVPTSISVILNGEVAKSSIYDLTYNNKNQILMILNKTANGTSNQVYEMSLNKENATFTIKLDGKEVITTNIKLLLSEDGGSVEITEDSNGSVISISDGKITPVSEGFAIITLTSDLDKSIFTTLSVQVIKGVTSIDLYKYENSSVGKALYNYATNTDVFETVYVDEVQMYKLQTKNRVNYTNYESTSKIAYLIEYQSGDGQVVISGIEYKYSESGNPYQILKMPDYLTFKGKRVGKVIIKVTPILILENIEYGQIIRDVEYNNFYVLESLAKSYYLEIASRASAIKNNVTNASITPKNSFPMTITLDTANVNLIYDSTIQSYVPTSLRDTEQLKVKFNNFDFVLREDGDSFSQNLIKLTLKSVEFPKTAISTSISNQNTYRIKFNFEIEFNLSEYIQHANDYDLNNESYIMKISPASNESLEVQTLLTINPIELTNIYTNFYSSGLKKVDQVDSEAVTFPNENESPFIVPGRKSMLKITLGQDYNDSSYITVSLDAKYRGYVKLTQLAGVLYLKTGDSYNDYLTGAKEYPEITVFNEIMYDSYFDTGATFGLRLNKLTLNYLDSYLFNNTYYVQILLDEKYVGGDILPIYIDSYKIQDGVVIHQTKLPATPNEKQLTKVDEYPLNLNIEYTPYLVAHIDDSSEAIIGKGVRKPIQITHRGINETIRYTISTNEINSEKVYITDEDGKKVNSGTTGNLSIEYLNSGKQYYLCVDVTADPSKQIQSYDKDLDEMVDSQFDITIHFHAEEYILGIKEETDYTLSVSIVEFEIEEISVNRVNDGVMELLQGESIILKAKIRYKEITVGTATDIKEFEKYLNTYYDFNTTSSLQSSLEITEYKMSGIEAIKTVGDTPDTYNISESRFLNLNYEAFREGYSYWTSVVVGSGTTIYEVPNIKLNREEVTSTGSDGNYSFSYIVLTALNISSDTKLRYEFNYYFDNSGNLIVAEANDVSTQYSVPVEFTINIKDNSSYDHPTPIENEQDLRLACNSTSGNYILINNITLYDWIPASVSFDSLDGNGYVITVDSFNLAGSRGGNNNVGIFSSTATNTVLKNMTINIAPLLETETSMRNEITKLENSTQEKYGYTGNVDLAYTSQLNFGILVGENNGSITNAKVINLRDTITENSKYLYVVSTGYLSSCTNNIAALVGHNSSSGVITNSFVGVNINGNTIKTVEDKTKTIIVDKETGSNIEVNIELDNSNDEWADTQIYPFYLAGCNNIAGLVALNDGVISNSYAKGVGIYNTNSLVNGSITSGFVGTNNNKIVSSFVEGYEIDEGHRGTDKFKVESKGRVAGFVYNNTGSINNAYSNVYLESLPAFSGGFVYTNESSGIIRNSYSTAINKNSLAHGQFTGVQGDGEILNYGTYENVYYLVLTDEATSDTEVATAVSEDVCSSQSTYKGFSFVTEYSLGIVNEDSGIWVIKEGELPKIQQTLIDTISFRKLLLEEEKPDEIEQVKTFNYTYFAYPDGTGSFGDDTNPLLISSPTEFEQFIINKSTYSDYHKANVFSDTHIRLINNIDFETNTSANKYEGKYLVDIIFSGVLDGNSLNIMNLNIITERTQIENLGLFGVLDNAIIKNVDITMRSYRANEVIKAGILAGTINNSSLINMNINGNNIKVSAKHISGGLAGLMTGENTIIDVTLQNISVESTYSSLEGEITALTEDASEYFFKQFYVTTEETSSTSVSKFNSLYGRTQVGSDDLYSYSNLDISNLSKVSYSGGVAGVIDSGITYTAEEEQDNSISSLYSSGGASAFKSNNIDDKIRNLKVKDNLTISTADVSGGLFGYVGTGTRVINSKLYLSDGNQLIKAFNYAGGIVGENHGIIEQCEVTHESKDQLDIDNSIITNDFVAGEYTLFDTEKDEDTLDYFIVSIGGIAGYSSNGVILDSYVKANVTKDQSFISGGIIGYAEDDNLINNSYNTGVVFAKYVMGGIVGLQVNGGESDTKLYLDNVISLTNWNDETYRQKISQNLYDNYKFMYANEDSYYEFYLKLPEIGNAPIIGPSKDITNEYRVVHSAYYSGSAIGKLVLKDTTATGYKLYNSAYYYDDAVDNENDEILTDIFTSVYDFSKYYSHKNVVTNTLGIYSTTGSTANGDKQDDYFTLTFALNDKLSVPSYRVSYIGLGGEDSLNYYSYNSIESNGIKDIFSFAQVFEAQEYVQQIVGMYSSLDMLDNLRTTYNLFEYGYSSNRYSGSEKSSFMTYYDSVWDLRSNKYIPDIAPDRTYDVIKINKDNLEQSLAEKELFDRIEYGAAARTYSIENDIEVVADATDTYINSSLNSIYASRVAANYISYGKTITFTINSIDIASIFDEIDSATFDNINFVIKISNIKSDKGGDNWGLFANKITNTIFTNCTFTIENNEVNLTAGVPNVGLLFGSMKNSQLNNCTINIVRKTINIENAGIVNFGYVVGNANQSYITNNTFNISGTLNINQIKDAVNLGLVVGLLDASTYGNNYINADRIGAGENEITINDYSPTSKNFGSMIGYVVNSTISGNNTSGHETNTVETNYNIVTTKDGLSGKTLNISSFIGAAEFSVIDSIYLVVSKDNNRLNISTNETDNFDIINQINVGTLIGYQYFGSLIGYRKIAGSAVNIEISSGDKISADKDIINFFNIGGLVGLAYDGYNLFNNSYYKGKISGTILSDKVESSDAFDVSVGGLVGKVETSLSVNDSVTYGTIYLSVNHKLITTRVGGIVGYSIGACTLQRFASLTDITINDNGTSNKGYIAGAVGYCANLSTTTNGYVYAILTTSSTANGNGSVVCSDNEVSSNNVYYCQEFITGKYTIDNSFDTFAMADLYSSISRYSNIYNLLNNGFKSFQFNNSYIAIPVPQSLANYLDKDLVDLASEGDNKYQPKKLIENVVNTDGSLNYNFVVVVDYDNDGSFTIDSTTTIKTVNNGQYISGRTYATGKSVNIVVTTPIIEGGNPYYNFIYSCSGVISNITFKPNYVDYSGQVYLVQTGSATCKFIGVVLTGGAIYGYSLSTGHMIIE